MISCVFRPSNRKWNTLSGQRRWWGKGGLVKFTPKKEWGSPVTTLGTTEHFVRPWDSFCDAHTWWFVACSLFSSEALQLNRPEPSFSETARRKWWDWVQLWIQSRRRRVSEVRADGSSGKDRNTVENLVGRKEECKHGGCFPGPHTLGSLTAED